MMDGRWRHRWHLSVHASGLGGHCSYEGYGIVLELSDKNPPPGFCGRREQSRLRAPETADHDIRHLIFVPYGLSLIQRGVWPGPHPGSREQPLHGEALHGTSTTRLPPTRSGNQNTEQAYDHPAGRRTGFRRLPCRPGSRRDPVGTAPASWAGETGGGSALPPGGAAGTDHPHTGELARSNRGTNSHSASPHTNRASSCHTGAHLHLRLTDGHPGTGCTSARCWPPFGRSGIVRFGPF
jgi:hypothetical protein